MKYLKNIYKQEFGDDLGVRVLNLQIVYEKIKIARPVV